MGALGYFWGIYISGWIQVWGYDSLSPIEEVDPKTHMIFHLEPIHCITIQWHRLVSFPTFTELRVNEGSLIRTIVYVPLMSRKYVIVTRSL